MTSKAGVEDLHRTASNLGDIMTAEGGGIVSDKARNGHRRPEEQKR